MFPRQKETKRFRLSGAASPGLKINSDEVNGKANTSGWQLEGSGSAQCDTTSKLSFSLSWPSHLLLLPPATPTPKVCPSTHSKTESSDLTSWTPLPKTLTLSALLLGGAKQWQPPDWAVACKWFVKNTTVHNNKRWWGEKREIIKNFKQMFLLRGTLLVVSCRAKSNKTVSVRKAPI